MNHKEQLAPVTLPAYAIEFIAELQITRRRQTVNHYKTALRHFHRFLACRSISPAELQRDHVLQFLGMLKDMRLAPGTRRLLTIQLRTYLAWLAEKRLLVADARDLVRKADLPKVPVYLPRPLPPDIDTRLQERLTASQSSTSQGLLLMRLSGVRVGELIALPYECLIVDKRQRTFLKVPLGKMDNERLVPLDARAADLVRVLQQALPLGREYLLPRSGTVKTLYDHLRAALKDATTDFNTDLPITTHRVRHTYATTMLNAGMSLLGVMKLLGHKDYRMTLRYTAITQDSVQREYVAALAKIEQRHAIPPAAALPQECDPLVLLDLCVHGLPAFAAANSFTPTVKNNLVKQLRRVQKALHTATEDRSGLAKKAR